MCGKLFRCRIKRIDNVIILPAENHVKAFRQQLDSGRFSNVCCACYEVYIAKVMLYNVAFNQRFDFTSPHLTKSIVTWSYGYFTSVFFY